MNRRQRRLRFTGSQWAQLALTALTSASLSVGIGTALLDHRDAGAPDPSSSTRFATTEEWTFCEANYDTLGPASGDCGIVPTSGEIFEDDPWGRWDWRTMGDGNRGLCVDGRWQLEHADGTITDDHPFSGDPELRGCS